MLEQFKIYSKTIDFLVWLFPTVNKFPKAQRFVLGQQIEKTTLEILALIIRANNQKDQVERKKILAQLDVEIEVLRALLRVAYLLRFLSHKQYEYFLEKVDELGKMLGGWMKTTSA